MGLPLPTPHLSSPTCCAPLGLTPPRHTPSPPHSAGKELLALPTPHLEPYLLRACGLLGGAAGGGAGAADPLSPLQVAHAEVLARLYIQRHEYAKAAEVSVWGVGPATWGVWV